MAMKISVILFEIISHFYCCARKEILNHWEIYDLIFVCDLCILFFEIQNKEKIFTISKYRATCNLKF